MISRMNRFFPVPPVPDQQRRQRYIEAFGDASDMKRHMFGAVIMGIGGVLALGCTIGQGLTGMSTLALGSLIALASIILGAVWGLKSLEEDSVIGGFKAIFNRE